MDLNWWIFFKKSFEHVWFKNAFDLRYYGFWKCGFNKTCSYLCDGGHECRIHMNIEVICTQNLFTSNM